MTDNKEEMLEELLKENELLRKEVKKLSSFDDIVVESLSGFHIEDLKDKLRITGILLAPGTHNGIEFSPKHIELMYKNFRDYLSKMQLVVEHGEDINYGEKVIGKHEKALWDPLLKCIKYVAIVDNKNAIKDIKNMIFRATSMRLKLKRSFTENGWKGKNFKPINNSLTRYPACKACQMFNFEDLSENNNIDYFGIKESKDLNIEDELNDKRGSIMENTDNKEETILEDSLILQNLRNYSFTTVIAYKCNDCGKIFHGNNYTKLFSHRHKPKVEEHTEDESDYPESELSIEDNAKWTRKYINDLPNSAFAVVEPCANTNKSARHLPYKDKTGKIDLPHLRNALARMNQINAVCKESSTDAIRAKAKRKLVGLAKKHLPKSKFASMSIDKDEEMTEIEKELQDLSSKDIRERLEKTIKERRELSNERYSGKVSKKRAKEMDTELAILCGTIDGIKRALANTIVSEINRKIDKGESKKLNKEENKEEITEHSEEENKDESEECGCNKEGDNNLSEEVKETPKPVETPKEIPKEVPNEKPKETPKEEPKETPKEVPKEEPKPEETPKEEPKETPKEKPKEEVKEVPKETPKEEPELEEVKEEPKKRTLAEKYKEVVESEGSVLDKATDFLIIAEKKKKWGE